LVCTPLLDVVISNDNAGSPVVAGGRVHVVTSAGTLHVLGLPGTFS
jgi:hypothetical protein